MKWRLKVRIPQLKIPLKPGLGLILVLSLVSTVQDEKCLFSCASLGVLQATRIKISSSMSILVSFSLLCLLFSYL